MNLPPVALIDTNWYIGFLAGSEQLPTLRYHSIVTRIEMLSVRDLDQANVIQLGLFLSKSEEIGLGVGIALRAAEFRRRFGGKLPDAIIAATANWYELPLLTRDLGMQRYSTLVDLPALL